MATAEHDRFREARRRMVERDLAARGIVDAAVLAAMGEVPRERFVDPALRDAAYDDSPLPIGSGQTISQPLVVALMVQALELRPSDRALDVGAGSGYSTAVLARLCRTVIGMERHSRLAAEAAARLAREGIDNAVVVVGDGTLGWPAGAPYDAILVSAGAEEVPPALIAQLAVGGRLVQPLGPAREQRLVRLRRLDADRLARDDLGSVRFVPLIAGSVVPDG